MSNENEAKATNKTNHKEALSKFNYAVTHDNEGYINFPHSTLERETATVFANIFDKNLESQVNDSVQYYRENGYYAQLIRHYATLLLYKGLLTPHPKDNKFSKSVMKKYNEVLKAVDGLNVPSVGKRIAYQVLLRGTYFGLIKVDGNELSLIDLPYSYCKVVGKDKKGNLVTQFDVRYFNSKNHLLDSYPKEIQKHYYSWKRNKSEVSPIIVLPTYMAAAFQLFNPIPYFLNSIPDIERYKDALELAKLREEKDIEKIIVQEIPHLTDGELLFEPDEAVEMHKGVLNMSAGSKGTSVITTYGKLSLLHAPSRDTAVRNNLNQMNTDIYAGAGVSKELFSASTSAAMSSTLKKDLSVMMTLAEQVSNFLQEVINYSFGTSKLEFSYDILPITYYNQDDYLKMTLGAANSGFSFFLPAIASGVNQRDLVNVKTLEKELGLKDLLEPLSSAFTQSSKDQAKKGGRPQLKEEEKSDKTVTNIEAGGSGNEDRAE